MKNRCRASIATAAFVAAVCVASAAQAFTMQDGSGQSSGQGFLDLDKPSQAPDRMAPVNRFGSENGQTTMKSGNGTLQFGGQSSFQSRYNTDNIFNPYAREGR